MFEYNIHMLNIILKKRCLLASVSLVLLIIGLLIYLLLRTDTYIHLFLPYTVQSNLHYIYCQIGKNYLTDFAAFYLVDFLWGLSLAFALCSVVSTFKTINILVCCLLAFTIGALYEIMQLSTVLKGTFDIIDICMYAVAAIICATINIKFILRRLL